MKFRLLAILTLLTGSALFAGPRVVIGFGVNAGPVYGPTFGYYAPPPPPPVYAYAPAPPVYVARPRYYVRPAYVAPYWVAPRYYVRRAYGGYWRR